MTLLTGCSHVAWQASVGQPPPASAVQANVSTGSGFAALLGLTIIAASAYEMSRGGLDYAGSAQRVPDMAPDRKVSEQDCTKPLDHTLGNIRCK